MKKISIVMVSLLLVLGLAGAAGAVPTTWTDTIDVFSGQDYVKIPPSATYTHDITDGANGFSGYLMGGDDIIWDYSLNIALFDDGGRYDGYEIAFVNQPGIIGDGFYNFAYNNNVFGWSLAGLISLNAMGNLTVTISSWLGDFYLDASTLVAHGDNGTAPVPEPATLILLGTGLLGIVGANRKRLSRKA